MKRGSDLYDGQKAKVHGAQQKIAWELIRIAGGGDGESGIISIILLF